MSFVSADKTNTLIRYGARPHTDPRVHQKSILGAILTTIMRAVVIYLLVMNTMDILSDSKLNVQVCHQKHETILLTQGAHVTLLLKHAVTGIAKSGVQQLL